MTTTEERVQLELARQLDAVDDQPPEWFRQSVQRTWQIGDRVRVLVAAECDLAVKVPWSEGHHPAEVGLTGTVVRMPPSYRREVWLSSHPIAVQYDPPGLRVRGQYSWGGAFSANELEPAPEPPDRDDQASAATEGEHA